MCLKCAEKHLDHILVIQETNVLQCEHEIDTAAVSCNDTLEIILVMAAFVVGMILMEDEQVFKISDLFY